MITVINRSTGCATDNGVETTGPALPDATPGVAWPVPASCGARVPGAVPSGGDGTSSPGDMWVSSDVGVRPVAAIWCRLRSTSVAWARTVSANAAARPNTAGRHWPAGRPARAKAAWSTADTAGPTTMPNWEAACQTSMARLDAESSSTGLRGSFKADTGSWDHHQGSSGCIRFHQGPEPKHG